MIIVVFVVIMVNVMFICYQTMRRNSTIDYKRFNNGTSNCEKRTKSNFLQMGILKLFHTQYYMLENPIMDIDELCQGILI